MKSVRLLGGITAVTLNEASGLVEERSEPG